MHNTLDQNENKRLFYLFIFALDCIAKEKTNDITIEKKKLYNHRTKNGIIKKKDKCVRTMHLFEMQ